MSSRTSYVQDPVWEHWRNPYRDQYGKDFCGHCGERWPCPAVRPRVMLENPEAAHQIRITVSPSGHLITGCCCGKILRTDPAGDHPASQQSWLAHARENGMDV